ncbi:Zinc knuckle CX2CX4HX4C [Arabidopsis thaliana x Arabidopsis arenosa]|uniref:Zinc knuckle CX2CX4HX4C n=1 Tax=Arabidopsis thaliana x Arabidopsis arenosa TaxID=1240361 RepID=A0A8T2C3I6_9BRAS|nr:Zinc knuckle CX2CX4HX4C [Arabidopsis thaliana x Arabidopsis arenosa]
MICFQYERLRRICTNCLRLTHHASQCPYNQYPPTPRNSPVTPASPISNEGRITPEFHGVPAYTGRYDDELQRSSFNSQSQVSEDSFPTPLSQPPRLESPPLNPDELAEAFPYFPTTDIEGIPHFAVPISHSESQGSQHFAVPLPQTAQGRQQSSTSSNIPSSFDYDKTSKMF